MRLRALTPTRVLIDAAATAVGADAPNGAFVLLPRHVDFATALEPGLLMYRDEAGDEHFVAIDGGTLVKRGDETLVATPRAVAGADLGELRRAVEEQFRQLDERERETRATLNKLEAGFVRRFLELRERAS